MNGFITLQRKIRKHPYWADAEKFRAWVDILLMAAFSDHERTMETGDAVELDRGEFIGSERYLSNRWRWSRGRVRRFLAGAIQAKEIEVSRETGFGTIYHVVNYDTYQPEAPAVYEETGPPNGTSNRPTNGTSQSLVAQRDTETPGPPNGPPIGPPNGPNRKKGIKKEGREDARDPRRKLEVHGTNFADLVRWMGASYETDLLKLAGRKPEAWAIRFKATWGPAASPSTESMRKGLSDAQWREVVRDSVGAFVLEDHDQFHTPLFQSMVVKRANEMRGRQKQGGFVGDTQARPVRR